MALSSTSAACNTATHHERFGYRRARHAHSIPPAKHPLPVRRHASDNWESGGVRSPISPTSSTSTTPRGGWSEGSTLPSPDSGRVYPQILSKPPLLHHRPTYELVVAQHPQTTVEYGLNDLSRLPLSPPLVVRLVVRNSVGVDVSASAEYPLLVAHITLYSAGSPHPRVLSTENLYGSTISGSHRVRDLDGALRIFFIFPDVGVRCQGRWRLHVTLLHLARSSSAGSPTVTGDGAGSSCLAEAWTKLFDVVSADGYIAPELTPLTRHLQNQGVPMYISNSVLPR